jgi:hypothetical protein
LARPAAAGRGRARPRRRRVDVNNTTRFNVGDWRNALTYGVDDPIRRYRPYAIPGSSTDGTTQNDVLFSSPGPGTVYKARLKIHLGGA